MRHEAIDEAARELIAAIQQNVRALDALNSFEYANYAARWQTSVKS
jgi:hypothetical protein